MNIGMNGVLVLHHSFFILLNSVFLYFLCIPSTHFSFFFSLPKTEDTPIPREFHHLYFQIPQHFSKR